MKTHKINPNDICENLANFTIEYRIRQIPQLGDRAPSCQRLLRLTEIPEIKTASSKPRKTLWHEIYAHDLNEPGHFAKWVEQRCEWFHWNGKPKDFRSLIFIN